MSMRKLSPRTVNYQRSSSIAHVNVVLLGALGVGKSALTVKFMTRRFIMEYDPFIEDTYSKREIIDGQDVQINVMDTFDKETIELEKFARWCDIAFIVFSITNPQSYNRAREYLEAITALQKTLSKDIPLTLIGNKMDMEMYREVSQQDGCNLAAEFECLYYEISAAEDYDDILSLFHDAARVALHGKEHLLLTTDGAASVARRSYFKRAKSPKPMVTSANNGNNGNNNGANDNNNDKTAPFHQRKPSPTFKLFNKSFKIFN